MKLEERLQALVWRAKLRFMFCATRASMDERSLKDGGRRHPRYSSVEIARKRYASLREALHRSKLKG